MRPTAEEVAKLARQADSEIFQATGAARSADTGGVARRTHAMVAVALEIRALRLALCDVIREEVREAAWPLKHTKPPMTEREYGPGGVPIASRKSPPGMSSARGWLSCIIFVSMLTATKLSTSSIQF